MVGLIFNVVSLTLSLKVRTNLAEYISSVSCHFLLPCTSAPPCWSFPSPKQIEDFLLCRPSIKFTEFCPYLTMNSSLKINFFADDKIFSPSNILKPHFIKKPPKPQIGTNLYHLSFCRFARAHIFESNVIYTYPVCQACKRSFHFLIWQMIPPREFAKKTVT